MYPSWYSLPGCYSRFMLPGCYSRFMLPGCVIPALCSGWLMPLYTSGCLLLLPYLRVSSPAPIPQGVIYQVYTSGCVIPGLYLRVYSLLLGYTSGCIPSCWAIPRSVSLAVVYTSGWDKAGYGPRVGGRAGVRVNVSYGSPVGERLISRMSERCPSMGPVPGMREC